MTCRERSGFLFAHTCDQPEVGSCSRCQKAICGRHRREHEGSVLCLSCHREACPQGGPRAAPDRGYYDYFDDPFWYARYHREGYPSYDARDYAAFDQPNDGAQGLELEKDVDAS